jgi:hypothetical protein
MSHEQLCELAKMSIAAVFADSSVSAQETLSSLRDLEKYIDIMIDALKAGGCE